MRAWVALVVAAMSWLTAAPAMSQEWQLVRDDARLIAKSAAPGDTAFTPAEFWVVCENAERFYFGLALPFDRVKAGKGAETSVLIVSYDLQGTKRIASSSRRTKLPYQWGYMFDGPDARATLETLLSAGEILVGTTRSAEDLDKASIQHQMSVGFEGAPIARVIENCADEYRRKSPGGPEDQAWKSYPFNDGAAAARFTRNGITFGLSCDQDGIRPLLLVDAGTNLDTELAAVSGIALSVAGQRTHDLVVPGSLEPVDDGLYVFLSDPADFKPSMEAFRTLFATEPVVDVSVVGTGSNGSFRALPHLSVDTAGADPAFAEMDENCATEQEPEISEGAWTSYSSGSLRWAATRSSGAELRFSCNIAGGVMIMNLQTDLDPPPETINGSEVELAILTDSSARSSITIELPVNEPLGGPVISEWARLVSSANREIDLGLLFDRDTQGGFHIFVLGTFTAKGSTAALRPLIEGCP